jgi:hypothetical protein
MLELGSLPEIITGDTWIDLPEQELIQFPDDPAIPHHLLDDTIETRLIQCGDVRTARHIHQRRKHLYRVWLAALNRLKLEIEATRLRSRRFPFDRVLGFDCRISKGILLLRLAGFLHFSGISKRLDRPAVETARRMAALCLLRTY